MKNRNEIIKALNSPFPITPRPFAVLANDLGIDEDAMIEEAKRLKKEKVINRVGLILDHRKVGLSTNALVAWKIRGKGLNVTGREFALYPEVSHCYSRRAYRRWPYNLYTMVHATSRKQCKDIIGRMLKNPNVKGHKVLWTVKEFKKTSTQLKELLK